MMVNFKNLGYAVVGALALWSTSEGCEAAVGETRNLVDTYFETFPDVRDIHGAKIPRNVRERALGAFMGALVGDAAGAACEYGNGRPPTEKRLDEAMSMTDGPKHGAMWGNTLHRGSGQVTDDGEQVMETAYTLAKSRNDTVNPDDLLDAIIIWYKTGWAAGRQTRKAMEIANKVTNRWEVTCGLPATQPTRYEEHVTKLLNSEKGEVRSEANGSLMRMIPLAVWGYKLTSDQLFKLVLKAARVTHTTHIPHITETILVIIAANLIRHGNLKMALKEAHDWFLREQKRDNVYSQEKMKVARWMTEATDMISNGFKLCEEHADRGYRTRGWARWAFIQAMAHTTAAKQYPDAIRTIISQGGDTDTNACIAGGVLGALNGIYGIPASMLNPVLSRAPGTPGIRVPARYYTHKALELADSLLQVSPRPEKFHLPPDSFELS